MITSVELPVEEAVFAWVYFGEGSEDGVGWRRCRVLAARYTYDLEPQTVIENVVRDQYGNDYYEYNAHLNFSRRRPRSKPR